MNSLAPRFQTGMEAAQRMFGVLDRSVREMREHAGCMAGPTALAEIESVARRIAPAQDFGAEPIVIYRVSLAKDGGGLDPPPRRVPDLAAVSQHASIGPGYRFWIDDGADFCA